MDDLPSIVARTLGAVLTAGLLAWLYRRAQAPAERVGLTDVRLLRYGPSLRWLFVVVGLGFAALFAFTVYFNPADIDDPNAKLFWPTVLIEAIALVGGLETWAVKIELSDYGILSRSPWTGTRRLAWGEIQSVKFSTAWYWFEVRGMTGTTVYVHPLLSGLESFAQMVRTRLAPEVFSPADPYLDGVRILS